MPIGEWEAMTWIERLARLKSAESGADGAEGAAGSEVAARKKRLRVRRSLPGRSFTSPRVSRQPTARARESVLTETPVSGDSSREEIMPSYLIPPHLACPLSGEPLVEPVVIVGVHAPEKTPTLRLGETVDLQSLRDMFKNGSTGALSAACSFVRNRTIESAIEDFACQKLAESLPISSLQEGDVHPTVAAVLGQILAQHELAAWHDRARELALAPSRESLTSLAAIMARKNKSWKVMQREFVCVNRQKEWEGELFVQTSCLSRRSRERPSISAWGRRTQSAW